MKNDRKPVYSKSKLTRVVSASNGLWQLQQDNGAKGTRETSPWFNRGQPTDLDEAMKNL